MIKINLLTEIELNTFNNKLTACIILLLSIKIDLHAAAHPFLKPKRRNFDRRVKRENFIQKLWNVIDPTGQSFKDYIPHIHPINLHKSHCYYP